MMTAHTTLQIKHALLIGTLLLAGCGDVGIDQRLDALSGSDYLSLAEDEKRQLVDLSLARFTTWRFWARPDLCDHVLNTQSIDSLYEQAARKAQDNPMMFTFVVMANDECVAQGQLVK